MFVREIELEIDGKEKIIQLDQKYEGDTGIGRYRALEVKYIGTQFVNFLSNLSQFELITQF